MSRVWNTTASGALVALVATLGMSAPSFAGTKAHAMHMSRAHHARHYASHRAMPAPAVVAGSTRTGDGLLGRDSPFGPGSLFGGVNGTGATGGGAEDPANFRSAGLDGGGLLGTGVLDGQGALGLGVLGF